MFERFGKQSQSVVLQALIEAQALGSPVVEAEHVLMALTGSAGGPARGVLADAGLDHDAVRAALDAERDRSLAAVGVSAGAFGLPEEPTPLERTPGWGSSAKTALKRAATAAAQRGERRIQPAHILLGLLSAELGTVPRALAMADVDRTELAAATHRRLDAAA
jgi:ATP-dependent Clp protease ATP-binding subunit ClpA